MDMWSQFSSSTFWIQGAASAVPIRGLSGLTSVVAPRQGSTAASPGLMAEVMHIDEIKRDFERLLKALTEIKDTVVAQTNQTEEHLHQQTMIYANSGITIAQFPDLPEFACMEALNAIIKENFPEGLDAIDALIRAGFCIRDAPNATITPKELERNGGFLVWPLGGIAELQRTLAATWGEIDQRHGGEITFLRADPHGVVYGTDSEGFTKVQPRKARRATYGSSSASGEAASAAEPARRELDAAMNASRQGPNEQEAQNKEQ